MQGEESQKIVQEFRLSTKVDDVVVEVKVIDLGVDRERYLSMKACMGCNVSFGKQGSKKYYCHFCYGALCSECSLLTLKHPETEKDERTCNPCYVRYLKDKVLELSDGFVKVKLKQEIEEKEREIARRKQLVEEIKNVKQSLEIEKSEKNKQISAIEEKIKAQEAKNKESEEANKQLHSLIEELVKSGRINPDEYKTFNPHFIPTATPREETCLKCQIF